MAEGFRFMPLGLVRLRMGYLRCNINAGVRWASAEQTCHSEMTISSRWEMGLASVNDVTHWKRMEDFGNLKKVSGVWEYWTPNEKGWLLLARGGLGQVSHEGGGDEKARIEKNVCIFSLMSKNL